MSAFRKSADGPRTIRPSCATCAHIGQMALIISASPDRWIERIKRLNAEEDHATPGHDNVECEFRAEEEDLSGVVDPDEKHHDRARGAVGWGC